MDKFNWWKENCQEDYNEIFKSNEDIFEKFK